MGFGGVESTLPFLSPYIGLLSLFFIQSLSKKGGKRTNLGFVAKEKGIGFPGDKIKVSEGSLQFTIEVKRRCQ